MPNPNVDYLNTLGMDRLVFDSDRYIVAHIICIFCIWRFCFSLNIQLFYQCKWQPPDYAKGEDTSANYHKTLIAGFPSGDKRMIFTQMEALTGLREFYVCLVVGVRLAWYLVLTSSYFSFCIAYTPAAKDEWDFEFIGDSNHPFIKANYPHHEGIWGWGG